jgi:serine/threonine-protein kinase
MEAITYKICHEDPQPPSRLSKLKLPMAVDQLVSTALAKDPATRFQNAHAFRDALRDVAEMSVEVEDGQGTTMVAIGTLMLQKPAPTWDEDTLRTAERELARALGPMAKVIVHRAAAQTTDRAELCSILSSSITDPEMRRNFVTAFERTAGSGVRTGASGQHGTTAGHTKQRTGTSISPGTSHSGTMSTQGIPLEPEFIDEVTAMLTVYIGPIAQVVTRKAMRESKNRTEFLRKVADSLGTQERVAFLREVGLGGS